MLIIFSHIFSSLVLTFSSSPNYSTRLCISEFHLWGFLDDFFVYFGCVVHAAYSHPLFQVDEVYVVECCLDEISNSKWAVPTISSLLEVEANQDKLVGLSAATHVL